MKLKRLVVLLMIIVMGITACEEKESTKSTKDNNEQSDVKQDKIDNKIVHNSFEQCIREGEWFYYVDGGILYKMKCDGSSTKQLTNIKEIEILEGGPIIMNKITIIGDWIYTYANDRQSSRVWWGTVKVKKDGSKWETEGSAGFPVIYKGEYGYTLGVFNSFRKIKLENNNEEGMAYAEEVEYIYDVIDDFVYYNSRNSMKRIKIDTEKEENILGYTKNVIKVVFTDDWIYYATNDGDDDDELEDIVTSVYRMSMDGKQKECIVSKTARYINDIYVCDNMIYCDFDEIVAMENADEASRKQYFSAIDIEKKEEAIVNLEDIKEIDLKNQNDDGYGRIKIVYLDNEYVIFGVNKEENTKYYINDLKGNKIIEL